MYYFVYIFLYTLPKTWVILFTIFYECGNTSQDLLLSFVYPLIYKQLCKLFTCTCGFFQPYSRCNQQISSCTGKSRFCRKWLTFLDIGPEPLHPHCDSVLEEKTIVTDKEKDRLVRCNILCLLFPRGSFPCKFFARFHQ